MKKFFNSGKDTNGNMNDKVKAIEKRKKISYDGIIFNRFLNGRWPDPDTLTNGGEMCMNTV